ncbi:DUF4177 domain-containing protein [Mannheimia sp. ZY171111]|uniref:DUF4177 domain-containing protein n=1 Tax=Mannheimia sp. ZY171111 TaxID=2679995 RepID=UPI001ADD6CE1|nr:DUF4177 domain-containing protein [Mannheimia sp. ZY171111]QTM01914.1 DUF4177 domain-containing protein [Mannheimia sp. ZY171111]
MKYEYKMVQVPPNIMAVRKNIQTAAADYLQGVVNEHASEGWEFFRIDDFNTEEKLGCLSGGKTQTYFYKVITFRREKA